MADTTTTVTQAARRASDAVGDNLGRLRDDLETADQRLRQVLHQYPLAALFAAIASGYLVGRLASRR